MARLFRSPLARRDIIDVLKRTKERWGEAQALEYRDLIRDALRAVAADPSCGKVRGIRPGILSHHIKQPVGTPGTSCSIAWPRLARSRSLGFCTTRWTSINTSPRARRLLGGLRARCSRAARGDLARVGMHRLRRSASTCRGAQAGTGSARGGITERSRPPGGNGRRVHAGGRGIEKEKSPEFLARGFLGCAGAIRSLDDGIVMPSRPSNPTPLDHSGT